MYTETQILGNTVRVSANRIQSDEAELVINVGPQHPATHGVLHLVITLQGETIKKVEPQPGLYSSFQLKKCAKALPIASLSALQAGWIISPHISITMRVCWPLRKRYR
jgi:hypothetical protein